MSLIYDALKSAEKRRKSSGSKEQKQTDAALVEEIPVHEIISGDSQQNNDTDAALQHQRLKI